MSYIAERREEEKERRRAEIVDAAEALYAEIGWDATTIDEVARRARLSRALVYVYFKDKRDLHFAIAERSLRTLKQRFEQAVSEHDLGLDKVKAIGRAYVAFSVDLPHYFDACSRFQAHEPEGDLGELAQTNEGACLLAGREVHEVLVAAIEAGIADGTVRSDIGRPVATSFALWAFTHGIIQITATKRAHLAMLGVDVPELIQQAFALLEVALANRA